MQRAGSFTSRAAAAGLCCHPERSKGSLARFAQVNPKIPRIARNDKRVKSWPAILLLLAACAAPEQQSDTASTSTVTPPTAAPPTSTLPTETGLVLPPVDEGPSDPSFLAFRDRLLDVIKRRDREALLSVLDPNIRVSFGDDGGVEGFKRYWKLDQPDSKVWQELEEALRLGGTFQTLGGRRSFCAPYVYSAYPENGPDPFESLVVIGPRVELREKPDGRMIALLAHNIVRISQDDPMRGGNAGEPGWRKVVTASGKEGWVEERFLRSHVDYRACFSPSGNDWKMDLFVAGD